MLDHASAGSLLGTILLLLAMGVVPTSCGVAVFARAASGSFLSGLLKRNG